ncbi:nitrate ABC transporter permease [Polynucleobacter sp. CS-Odin-A6]|uniref:nitrate ABC transporter permease n=1 Tax=Polynucleobacter sp. CS-Odin-A6 TaxID=2689106 RepID=UPI001C0B6E91|nr:nitrate ABC transporter permease [Polynucleobacter sp. CS-Odin-A6]MBU3620360.1 nitrate ABC transporter permease [Polynucleobacter sp. CS-Odin-A6]
MKTVSIRVKGAILSVVILLMCLFIWHMATTQKVVPSPGISTNSSEYSSLMGQGGSEPVQKTGFPTLTQMGKTIYKQLSHPFYDNGPNDKGIGIQLAYSLARVGLGFLLAMIVAIPLGFWIGMSPLANAAFNPFIQILKPISPLAWMPIALYTIKDSSISGIFVIFICSVWPMLLNTAFGVASVRKELLNVTKTLEVSPLRKAFLVILPAAAPTILTGMRISMGIAWLVIVAAEMLVGGTGIGYFLWNEWNNLSLSSVIFAILLIGIVGMLLDTTFAKLQKAVSYAE